jgi:integrase
MGRPGKVQHRPFGTRRHVKRNGLEYLRFSYQTPLWAFDEYPNLHLPQEISKTLKPEYASDGEAWLITAENDLRAGKWMPPQVLEERRRAEDMLFKDYADEYIETRRTKQTGRPLAQTTKDKYREYLDESLLPFFGDRTMRSIKTEDIQKWYDDFPIKDGKNVKHGYSQRMHIYRDLLRGIFNRAATNPIDDDGTTLIKFNPCTIVVEKPQSEDEKRSILSPAVTEVLEMVSLYEAMPDWCSLAVLFGGVIGLREGEIAALQRKDIDFAGGSIEVAESVKPVKDDNGHRRLVKEDTKTHQIRSLPVLDDLTFLVPLIHEHLDRFVDDDPDAFLFSSPAKGGMVSGQTLRNCYYRARKSVPRLETNKTSFHHATRAAAESHLDEFGASRGTYKAILGHANENVDDLYLTISEPNFHETLTKLNNAYLGEFKKRGLLLDVPYGSVGDPTHPVEHDAHATFNSGDSHSGASSISSAVDIDKVATMMRNLSDEQRAETLGAFPVDVRAAVMVELAKR